MLSNGALGGIPWEPPPNCSKLYTLVVIRLLGNEL